MAIAKNSNISERGNAFKLYERSILLFYCPTHIKAIRMFTPGTQQYLETKDPSHMEVTNGNTKVTCYICSKILRKWLVFLHVNAIYIVNVF